MLKNRSISMNSTEHRMEIDASFIANQQEIIIFWEKKAEGWGGEREIYVLKICWKKLLKKVFRLKNALKYLTNLSFLKKVWCLKVHIITFLWDQFFYSSHLHVNVSFNVLVIGEWCSFLLKILSRLQFK
jgi:hypothetical protein